jgi:hypothetical protein
MGKRPDPLFLERSSYRQRRLQDAVRLFIFLGALLWMIPVLWPTSDADGTPVPMSAALFYVFGVWVLLILTAAALAFRAKNPPERTQGDPRRGSER